MMIQCLIQRDGDTVVTRGGVNYVFRQNSVGHAVCEVQNDDHARVFLRMGPSVYRPYGQQAYVHARALKMVPKQTVVDEEGDSGEVFEESVGIVEGEVPGEAIEDADVTEPEGVDGALFRQEDQGGDPIVSDPLQDPLVLSVATRLHKDGNSKTDACKALREQFGLSAADAKQVFEEATK